MAGVDRQAVARQCRPSGQTADIDDRQNRAGVHIGRTRQQIHGKGRVVLGRRGAQCRRDRGRVVGAGDGQRGGLRHAAAQPVGDIIGNRHHQVVAQGQRLQIRVARIDGHAVARQGGPGRQPGHVGDRQRCKPVACAIQQVQDKTGIILVRGGGQGARDRDAVIGAGDGQSQGLRHGRAVFVGDVEGDGRNQHIAIGQCLKIGMAGIDRNAVARQCRPGGQTADIDDRQNRAGVHVAGAIQQIDGKGRVILGRRGA